MTCIKETRSDPQSNSRDCVRSQLANQRSRCFSHFRLHKLAGNKNVSMSQGEVIRINSFIIQLNLAQHVVAEFFKGDSIKIILM